MGALRKTQVANLEDKLIHACQWEINKEEGVVPAKDEDAYNRFNDEDGAIVQKYPELSALVLLYEDKVKEQAK